MVVNYNNGLHVVDGLLHGIVICDSQPDRYKGVHSHSLFIQQNVHLKGVYICQSTCRWKMLTIVTFYYSL